MDQFNIGCWMTVYNRADLLIDTIHSLLKCHDLTGIKFVICNDGSTDEKVERIIDNFIDKLKAKGNTVVLINHEDNYGKLGYDKTLKKCFDELMDCKYHIPIPADFIFSPYLFQVARACIPFITGKVKAITFCKDSRDLHSETKVIEDHFIGTVEVDWYPGIFDVEFVKEFIPGMINMNSEAGTGTTHTIMETAKKKGYTLLKYKDSLCEHKGNIDSAMNQEYRRELPLKQCDINFELPDILIGEIKNDPIKTNTNESFAEPYTVDGAQSGEKSADDNSLLICTGNGIGNALETLSLCQAGHDAGRVVDVLINCNEYTDNPDVSKFFKKVSCINKSYTLDEYKESDKIYNKVLFLWGGPPVENTLIKKNQEYIKLPHSVNMRNEIETNFLYSSYFDYKGPVPFDWKTAIRTNNKYRDYVAIHIGCNPQQFWRDKRVWQGFDDLFKKLKSEKIVIVGSKQDADIPVELTSNCTDLRSEALSLVKTAAVLKACKYLITCDSGVMQLSNVMKVKAFSLWGGTAWTRSLPKNKYSVPIIKRLECQPCQFQDEWTTCDEAECLKKIKPDEVIEVIKNNKKEKPILVILCTYNRNDVLKKSITSMLKTSKSPLNIFVYDDCSDTPFKMKRKNIKIHHAGHKIKNSGQRKTKMIEMALKEFPFSEWIYLTDDDFHYDKKWDIKLQDLYYSEVGVGLVTGFNTPGEFEKHKGSGTKDYYYPEAVSGGSMFLSADTLYSIIHTGNFWERMNDHHGMFDYELSKEIGKRDYKIKSVVTSFVHHNPWGAQSMLHDDNRNTCGVTGDVLPITVITIIYNDFMYWLDNVKKLNEKQISQLILISNRKEDHEKVKNFQSDKFLLIERIYNDTNIGFTKAMNVGMRGAKQETLLWMSPDIIIPQENTLQKIHSDLWSDENIGLASCYHLRKPIDIHYAGGLWLKPEDEVYQMWQDGQLPDRGAGISVHDVKADITWNNNEIKDTRWITGGFVMMKRSTLKQIGYMDENYFFFRSDSTYCLKAWRAGLRCILSPTYIIHFVGKSGVYEGKIKEIKQ